MKEPRLAKHDNERIAFLDGLRGIAILSVVAWHYTNWGYVRFFPYGKTYSRIPLLDHGWVGVNLFFLISGYVILLTLQRCATFREFIARRWLRLFPAMLIASLVLFAVSRFLGDYMPHGTPAAINLLPGLTFVIPSIWEFILQRPVDELDGAFWTLYVEVGFYVTFGLLYSCLGWRRGLAALTLLWLIVVASSRIAAAFEIAHLRNVIEPLQWIGAEYFGWFVSGALFLKATETDSRLLFGAAVAAGVTSALTSGLWQPSDVLSRIYLVTCVAFFAAVQRTAWLQAALSARWLLFLGVISYPLYLLHNELGIGLIAKAGEWTPTLLWPVLPLLTMIAMIGAAWVLARWLEPAMKSRLSAILMPLVARTKKTE
jgi:peptidoglycan/LPS O-acetylase OafA/YrhL